MKTKHIFSFVLAASMMAACSNEEIVDSSNELKGKMIDATNLELVGTYNAGNPEGRASYLPQYVYMDGTEFVVGVVKPVWENGDVIGFSHIYPTDQKLVTNYRFDIANGVGTSTGAIFTTENSTIFAGDYFVYYPFNEDYHDYEGVPFALDAVQTQNATSGAVVNVGTITTPVDATEEAILRAAGAHLTKYRFSIGNRIEVEPAVNQAEFALNQYTSTLAFLIWPKNQTNTIHIQRIEMVSANGTALEIPVEVRFNAEAGKDEPVATVVEDGTESKAVLLFENVADGGLKILANGTKQTATLGYMSMIPNTYAKDSYKFVVYYQENSIMKKREVASYKDLVLESNSTTFYNIELDANGATEVVDNEIWTETEFASAVTKSNAVTNGEVKYTIMQPITLTESYELESAVPVKFEGEQTVTLAEGKNITFNSAANIVFDNIISSNATTQSNANVYQGNVEIKGVASDKLVLAVRNDAEVSVLNEAAEGDLKYVVNKGKLTLANVVIAERVDNTPDAVTDVAVLELADATIGGDLTSNSAGSVTLEDVTITTGNWTNTKGDMSAKNVTIGGGWTNTKGDLTAENVTVKGQYTSASGAQTEAAEMKDVNVYGAFVQQGGNLNLTGTNVLAYTTEPSPAISNFFSYNNKVNVVNSTTTIGNLGQSDLYLAEGSADAVTFTVKGISNLTNSFVLVDAKATYNAEGKVFGLKGDGTPANSTMVLEGKLTTDADVTLDGNFDICGTIENKANGLWTIDNTNGVRKFNHSHTTAPKFTNAGKVIVEGIETTAEVTSIANVQMAKDLYKGTGILVWKGMKNLTDVDAIYALGADCYATDLHAELNASSAETLSSSLNWSEKNIILDAKAAYTGNFATDKKLSAKNLTVNVDNHNFKLTGHSTLADYYVVNVTETLSLNKLAAGSQATEIDLTSSICKDIEVNNAAAAQTHEIKNGINMWYTGSYNTTGNVAQTAYPNNIPQLKN